MNNEEVLLIFKRINNEFFYITNNEIYVRQILEKCFHQQIIIIFITRSLGAPPGPDF